MFGRDQQLLILVSTHHNKPGHGSSKSNSAEGTRIAGHSPDTRSSGMIWDPPVELLITAKNVRVSAAKLAISASFSSTQPPRFWCSFCTKFKLVKHSVLEAGRCENPCFAKEHDSFAGDFRAAQKTRGRYLNGRFNARSQIDCFELEWNTQRIDLEIEQLEIRKC